MASTSRAADTPTATATTAAIAGAAAAFSLATSGSVAIDTVTSTVLGYDDASTTTAGAATIAATATPQATAFAVGLSGGTLAVGTSLANADISSTVDAHIGGTTVTLNSLALSASLNLPGNHNAATATAYGSSGGILAAVATDTEAKNTSMVTAGVAASTVLVKGCRCG